MNVPVDLKMERLPESLFNLAELDKCLVRDSLGKPVAFKNIRSNSICIIIFIRHFLDYVTREYVEDFSKIFPRYLENNNIKIILIGCGPSRYIEQFCEETNYPHHIYCDSQRSIHKVLGLLPMPEDCGSTDSPHVKTNSFLGFLQTVWRVVKVNQQGDQFQQGGQLIIDQDDRIIFFHRDSNPLDHTPINHLLKIAGLPRLDFKTRYITKHL